MSKPEVYPAKIDLPPYPGAPVQYHTGSLFFNWLMSQCGLTMSTPHKEVYHLNNVLSV